MSRTANRRALRQRLLLLPPLMALAACAQPGVAPPQAGLALPESWSQAELAPVTIDIAEYWRPLGDPLLTEFVEAALAENLELAQSAARLEQARAQLASARAGWFPQIAASGRT